jgi:dihydrofolate synthase/folylpolyglutamate synthase
MKFGLRNIRRLLASVGNPHRRFASVHIAGTNGKGSTCAFLSSILMEGGVVTGLYTSPHLLDFNERIRINGVPIPDDRLATYVTRLRPAIEATKATFFEATTCIAFLYFADEGVELAVLETGLGGRLDATNVVIPLVSVITNISRDHTQLLGESLVSITREKAGIMKRGVPCVVGENPDEVQSEFRRIAARRKVPLILVRNGSLHSCSDRGMKPGFYGLHQKRNAEVALAALKALRRVNAGIDRRMTRRIIGRGLRNVGRNSGLRGRLERTGPGGKYILDVAHNVGATEILVSELVRMKTGPLVVVFGVMKDKDYPSMVQCLARLTSTAVTVAPRTTRALPENRLWVEFSRNGVPVTRGGTVRKGIVLARALARRRGQILITGSHYVVGEALGFLGKRRIS